MGALGAVLVAWVLSWPSGAVRAAVAMKGWEWFVADTFGVSELGFIQAWGFFLLISFATFHVSATPASDKRPGLLVLEGFFISLTWSVIGFASLLVLVSLR